MRISTTFIPTDCVRALLGALWNEYKYGGDTREILIDLRAELGKPEFALFEKDMAGLMERVPAKRAVYLIARAAIWRSEQIALHKKANYQTA
jgi:hypothetical protein